jgi:hypothetical protein
MFRIDYDRMYVVYSIDDRDLALALLDIEGLVLAAPCGKQPIKYRTNQGHWEQRVMYKSALRERASAQNKARHERRKARDKWTLSN